MTLSGSLSLLCPARVRYLIWHWCVISSRSGAVSRRVEVGPPGAPTGDQAALLAALRDAPDLVYRPAQVGRHPLLRSGAVRAEGLPGVGRDLGAEADLGVRQRGVADDCDGELDEL